ncbi:MAG: hypothetical protein L3J17_11225 [Candidatus Jettenia sp.]|nr:MAG: hypothetical protein L3J17_11225 [Candidatus Jettenia sp.]
MECIGISKRFYSGKARLATTRLYDLKVAEDLIKYLGNLKFFIMPVTHL